MEKTQRKPSLSGLEVRVLVRELGTLSGGYVSSIHSLGESQVIRVRRAGGGDSSVVVSPRYGAWITERPAQTETTEFTTALRQELLRLRLERVDQHDLDRVVFFSFSGREGVLRLILELMPPGNIILTDTGSKILLSLRESRGPQRTILRGRIYAPPPQTRLSPEQADEDSLAEAFSREETVGKALGRGLSLPRKYVDEVLARASLAQEDPTPVPSEVIRKVLTAVRSLVSGLNSPRPSLVRSGEGVELMAVVPSVAEVIDSAATMSALADRVFSPQLLEEESRPKGGENSQVKEMEVTLQRLEKQIGELRNRAALLREAAAAVRAASSTEEVQQALARDGIDPALREELRGAASPAAVSSTLFDEAKAAEAEITRIRDVQRNLRPRLERAQKATPASRVRVVTRASKEWYEKLRWFFTTEGRLAVGGRDAQTNTILVKKYLEEGDVAYHADLFGSPFFILKDGARQTPDEVRQVAQATVAFSSAWKTGLAAGDAYWVSPDQISSAAPSGEFLARGSFVIRGKKNFVTKNPVEIAVGLDSKGRVMAGPEEALMKLSRGHVTIIPSREKSSDTAKKVLFELKKLYGDAPMHATLDDVLRALPAGGGKIIRRRENRRDGAGSPS